MKPVNKDSSKESSFWGMFFSITLHATVLILVLFWGFSGKSNLSNSNGPIEVSLSGLPGGSGGEKREKPPQAGTPPEQLKEAKPEKTEPEEPEPEKVEKKEQVKAPPPEPVKKDPPKEPEKEEEKKVEVKKEEPKKEEPEKEEPKKEPEVEEKPKVAEKEPEKKEVIPLETEKKEEKPEPEKKKEVAKKPEPTEKPAQEKKEVAQKKNLEGEKKRVLQDIQRQKVLENLKKGGDEGPRIEQEEIGEERRLAMADSMDMPESPGEGPGESGGSSGGGSSTNPVLIQLYTNKVHQRISRNWRIPPGVPTDGSLVSLIFFKVDERGKVYDVRVNKSSGNSAFDQFCVDAIYKSAPLPAPPSEFADEAKNKGVLVPFRNEPF
ncbi:MAG: cell envelope integrity protein TolA [Deltaproteobacteria bacterium]